MRASCAGYTRFSLRSGAEAQTWRNGRVHIFCCTVCGTTFEPQQSNAVTCSSALLAEGVSAAPRGAATRAAVVVAGARPADNGGGAPYWRRALTARGAAGRREV